MEHLWTDAAHTWYGLILKYPQWETFCHLIRKSQRQYIFHGTLWDNFLAILKWIRSKTRDFLEGYILDFEFFPIKWEKLSHVGYFKWTPNRVPSALVQKCTLSKSLWFLFTFISYLVLCPTMSHALCTAFEFFPIKGEKLSHVGYIRLAPNWVPTVAVVLLQKLS